jgi:biopolymer transport protein ExbD
MKIKLNNAQKVRIEMLPMMDCVFLLLVFFIYAMLSMAIHRGLPVNLPSSKTVKVDKKLVLAVTIQADGSIFIDKEPVALDNVTTVLTAKAQGQEQPGVLLFADRLLTYQSLFEVLDRIQKAGLNRISLQAQLDESP